jgi:predicted transcriptional regulator
VGVRDAGRSAEVISQSDISGKVAAENKYPDWMRVSEIRSRDLLVLLPEFPLMQCLRLMEKHSVFHLLVEEVSARFPGMILVADFLQIIDSDH